MPDVTQFKILFILGRLKISRLKTSASLREWGNQGATLSGGGSSG